MAAVQLGMWTLLEKYGIPLLNYAIIENMKTFGVSEEVAKDIMANKVIRAFEEVGIFAITLKTKLPIRFAEYLGFTSKGYAIRTITSEAGLVAEKTAISATAKAVATAAEVEKVAEVVAKNRGLNFGIVGTLWKTIMSNVSATAVVVLAAANVMDFANWQGAYQKTFEKIFTALGFPPDSPMPKAKTLSAQTWTRIYATVETLNPIGISYPFSDIDKPYSRGNLADLIDEVAANLVKNGSQATYKNVIGMALPMIQLNGKPDISKMDNLVFEGSAVAPADAQNTGTSKTITKVFTGIVSQGTIGAGLSFQARPDDMIESVDELKTAAANNLAPFLASLPGKVVYEVKVVSSITTKDGFKQTGTVQKLVTGKNKNGTLRYKTVSNKFATLVLYALTDKGSRARLTTIVLGPVDSAKLTVAQNDLRSLETQLPGLVTTTNINDIKNIQTNTDVTVNAPQQATQPTQTVSQVVGNSLSDYSQRDQTTIQQVVGQFGGNVQAAAKFMGLNPMPTPVPITSSAVTSATQSQQTVPSATKLGANASTLYDWYQAQGWALPTIQIRATLYQNLGLGQSAYYTGTAEQNTKLLNALKAQ